MATSLAPRPEEASDHAAVVREVRRLVARCHQLGVAYATDDWSPLSDITLGLLLRRAGIQWEYVHAEHFGEVVWPPICGTYLLQLNRAQPPAHRRFALRHGLAHVLAGHVADLSFAHDGHHWMCWEERVADAFALADLVPERIGDRAAEVRKYCPEWSEYRLRDRLEELTRRAL